jgi:hypothetical protein
MTFAGSSPGLIRLRISPFIVVDPGFMVDLGDWDTPNQPHSPDQPRKSNKDSDKRDNLPSRSAPPVLAVPEPPF